MGCPWIVIREDLENSWWPPPPPLHALWHYHEKDYSNQRSLLPCSTNVYVHFNLWMTLYASISLQDRARIGFKKKAYLCMLPSEVNYPPLLAIKLPTQNRLRKSICIVLVSHCDWADTCSYFDVQQKLLTGEYKETFEFADDMRTVWMNCEQFNVPGDFYSNFAEQCSVEFERYVDFLCGQQHHLGIPALESCVSCLVRTYALVRIRKTFHARLLTECTLVTLRPIWPHPKPYNKLSHAWNVSVLELCQAELIVMDLGLLVGSSFFLSFEHPRAPLRNYYSNFAELLRSSSGTCTWR